MRASVVQGIGFWLMIEFDRINNVSDGLLAGRADFHHGLL